MSLSRNWFRTCGGTNVDACGTWITFVAPTTGPLNRTESPVPTEKVVPRSRRRQRPSRRDAYAIPCHVARRGGVSSTPKQARLLVLSALWPAVGATVVRARPQLSREPLDRTKRR